MDEKSETFVVHIVSFKLTLKINSDRAAQSSLLTKEVRISDKYSGFADVFSDEKALVLLKCTKLNEHAIKPEDVKQPLYWPIYSLGPVKLETLKTYIKTYLNIGFIWPSKSPAGAPILFNKKLDGNLWLYVDYPGLNNLMIKNQYLLLLIDEKLDRLGWAKRFTQLNLTNAYHQMRIKEGDKWKTAFWTRYGHFEYKVMPFSLFNAPATF